MGNPTQRIEYSCAGQPAVVEYDYGKGHVVWWASSTPLENGSLARANDLDLLLNSLGPREGHHFYWDESLHGDVRSDWSYAAGPALNMLRIGLPVLGLLIVLSFSRRSGPVRDLPQPARAAPIEFLEALGSLYRNAGAASTAVAVALERFRRSSLRLCGLRPKSDERSGTCSRDSQALPARRTPVSKLICSPAKRQPGARPSNRAQALKLIQKLHMHQESSTAAAKPGSQVTDATEDDQSKPQERAS